MVNCKGAFQAGEEALGTSTKAGSSAKTRRCLSATAAKDFMSANAKCISAVLKAFASIANHKHFNIGDAELL